MSKILHHVVPVPVPASLLVLFSLSLSLMMFNLNSDSNCGSNSSTICLVVSGLRSHSLSPASAYRHHHRSSYVSPQLSLLSSLSSSLLSPTITASTTTKTSTELKADHTSGTASGDDISVSSTTTTTSRATTIELFNEFASFLQEKQLEIIKEIEELEQKVHDASELESESFPNNKDKESVSAVFSNDRWGIFLSNDDKDDDKEEKEERSGSGGITRVIQQGVVVEKGACSFTLIREGKLTKERAQAICGRQQQQHNNDASTTTTTTTTPVIKEGDTYYAAALSMVLHTRSPMVPTFRSDVRIFVVDTTTSESDSDNDSESTGTTIAWFGGGSDLTPYYLFDEDITFFHQQLSNLCERHSSDDSNKNDTRIHYPTMKQACDTYFYLPARAEHRGVGGMFFDDLPATPHTTHFVQDVTHNWMSSWFPIIQKRQHLSYTPKQKQWQLLRRGRYLEFNLLYDRGVKFGLANVNPRVEGVMVSAPPVIAWEYNHVIEKNSEEERLMKILKTPIDWV